MELPFLVTVCGLDELVDHCDAAVTHVLSILDPDWPAPEVFGTYGEHAKLELRFDDVIEERAGFVAPQAAHIEQILAFGRDIARASGGAPHLLVHCHAGVSRSSASMALLVAQALPDQPGDVIFAEILRIRPQIWPNLRIVELGDHALGRGGDLIAAAHGIYRAQLLDKPYLADAFTSGGRAREVAAN